VTVAAAAESSLSCQSLCSLHAARVHSRPFINPDRVVVNLASHRHHAGAILVGLHLHVADLELITLGCIHHVHVLRPVVVNLAKFLHGACLLLVSLVGDRAAPVQSYSPYLPTYQVVVVSWDLVKRFTISLYLNHVKPVAKVNSREAASGRAY
jgi:hypothetical protein